MHVLRETAFVVRRELRRNFRSARGIALYALTLLGGLVAALIGTKVNELGGHVTDNYGNEIAREGAMQAFTYLYRGDAVVAERLAHAPATLVVTSWASVWLCPLLVALIGFDSISSERQHRTLRYMTVRTRRGSYFAGKWLGLWCTSAIVLFGVQVISWVCDLTLVHDPIGDILTWGPALFLVSLPILGAWSAVATFAGSLVRTPMIALLMIFGAFTVMWLLGNVGTEDTTKYLVYAYPSGLDHFLLRDSLKHVAIGLAACAAFPAIFVGGGSVLFARSEA